VTFCEVMVGRFKGGLAYVNILASMIFGGITGSGAADVTALGPIEINLMVKGGYKRSFAAALTACTAVQGPIIPPSIPFVIFASLTGTPVGTLFMSGVIPGILIGISMALVVAYLSRKEGFPASTQKYSIVEIIAATKAALVALVMPVIILGGILTGVFTPTEASAIAAVYSLAVTKFYYKRINFNELRTVLLNTAKTTAQIYLIVGFASVISWELASEQVPTMISNFVKGTNMGPYTLFFLFNIFILFNGMWISDAAQLVLFAPIFTPIFASLGVSPIHFGCVMVVNVMISLITPPYGVCLYLASIVSGEPMSEVTKESVPFIIVSIVVLFLVTYIPAISMTLPRLLGLV
ncbi:MAG TPA: TRAP transporter large permease, partial [Bacillota bacterium]|nr:TRAP transporter large permease [Bacillota bacterium]